MEQSGESGSLSRKKKFLFLAVVCGFLLVLLLAGAEIDLRRKGVSPWQKHDLSVRVRPGGRFFTKHPTLGYTHLPGSFQVTLRERYTFEVNHRSDSLRVTQPLARYSARQGRPEIWVLGGSITHGWALNDEETYCWLLQERFPDYEVVNFGVSGYGTLHSLIQFQARLEQGKSPAIAIVAYADFHDARNTFLRKRRKEVAPWNKLGPLIQPYARLDSGDQLTYSETLVAYEPFPLMQHSAFVHFLEQKYNEYEAHQYRSNEVSRAILVEMDRLAQERDIAFVVAGISAPPETLNTLAHLRSRGIAIVDISADLSRRGLTHRFDSHPSALANRLYANKLERFLRARILK